MKKQKKSLEKNSPKNFLKKETAVFHLIKNHGKYEATEVELDQKQDTFLINEITKTKDSYKAEILEYLVDYTNENNIAIKNTNEEVIGTIGNSNNNTEIQEMVKNHKDRFTKKNVTLKKEDNNLIVQKVEK